MIVNSKSIMLDASKNSYAVPAYNVNNVEWAKYILEACQEDKSPVILAFTEKAIEYIGGYNVAYNMIKSLHNDLKITIPVVIHLDHASSFEACKKAIDAGFTSVMIDASNLEFEDNVSVTNKVVYYARKNDVSVEAEIGKFKKQEGKLYEYPSLEEVSEFYLRTDVDSLAVPVGNVHGFYPSSFDINFELLGASSKEVRIPLVLHGGSFLDENKIKTAIFCGVSKININTELQYVWANEVKKYLNNNIDAYDPRRIIGSGEKSIKRVIHEKNRSFGSKNRAN